MGTSKQRGMIAAGALALAIFLGARAFRRREYFSNPPPQRGPMAERLNNRVDPNTASWQELAMLPGLGESHAKLIVKYRQENAHFFHTRPLFLRPEDLLPIRGIGVAMIEKLRPFLTFPATSPSTQAAEKVR